MGKRESLKLLSLKLRQHSSAMGLTQHSCQEAFNYHRSEYNRIRGEYLERRQELDKLPPATVEARDARWAKFGVIGSLYMARSCLRTLWHRMPKAGKEAKELASQIEVKLERLIELLQQT